MGSLEVAVARLGLEGVEVFFVEDVDCGDVVVKLGNVEELLENLLAVSGGERNTDGVGCEGGELVGEEGFEFWGLDRDGGFDVEEGGDDGFGFEVLEGVGLGDDV